MSYEKQVVRELGHKELAISRAIQDGQRFVRTCPQQAIPEKLQQMVDEVAEFFNFQLSYSGRGRPPLYKSIVSKGVTTEALAYITITSILARYAESSLQGVVTDVQYRLGEAHYSEGEQVEMVVPSVKTSLNQCQALVIEAVTHLDLFEIGVKVRDGARQYKGISCINLTAKGEALIGSEAMHSAQDATLHLPMIFPPLDWTGQHHGGYLTTSHPFVRPKRTTVQHNVGDISLAMAAVNKLQSVPYRINHAMYEFIRGMDARCLESYEKDILRVADDSLEDALYFPMSCDMRGRMYYLSSILKPEGKDAAKALLVFDDGCEIATIEEGKWLLIHYCNLWGDDKLPLDERVQWTLDNVGKQVWERNRLKNKDRFQQMAALIEVQAMLECLENGDVFTSHLPVAMDFTNNGFQIIAGLMRDATVAKEVNLLPSDTVHDLYTKLSGGGNRKGWKDVCVRIAYNASQRTKIDRLHSLRRDGDVSYEGEIKDLLKEIEAGVGEQCPSIGQFQKHVLAEAKGMLKDGQGHRYTTPSGWKVAVDYMHMEKHSIKAGGIQVSYLKKTDKLADKNVTASVPNMVHALDANVLQETVVRSLDSPLVAIHDSISTLATHAEIVQQAAIQSFVDVVGAAAYSGDVIGTLDIEACRDSSYMLS